MKKNMKRFLAGTIAAATLGVSALSMNAAAEGEMVRSFLTGKEVPEEIGRKRPMAIMLNNIYDALPQSGIEAADIIYECPVEGGITRLMGLFEDYKDVERIGSVRSSREYYIYFAREYDAMYCHYGQAWYALDLLWMPDTLNLSGLEDMNAGIGEGEVMYYRGDDFPAPHNVFTNYDMIMEGIKFRGYSREMDENYVNNGGHFQFAADGEETLLENGQDALVVGPGYDYNHPLFIYDTDTKQYTRYQFNEHHIDRNNGNDLKYDNVIFEYCSWEFYPDTDSYIDIDNLSGGTGLYMTRGKAIPITWKKEGANKADKCAQENFNVTRYYDMDGNEIKLNQGKTWINVVLDTNESDIVLSNDVDGYLATIN